VWRGEGGGLGRLRVYEGGRVGESENMQRRKGFGE
jgi:hypothetical protein